MHGAGGIAVSDNAERSGVGADEFGAKAGVARFEAVAGNIREKPRCSAGSGRPVRDKNGSSS